MSSIVYNNCLKMWDSCDHVEHFQCHFVQSFSEKLCVKLFAKNGHDPQKFPGMSDLTSTIYHV